MAMIMGQRATATPMVCAATIFAGGLLFYKTLTRKQKCQRKSKEDGRNEEETISHELSSMDAVFYKYDLPPITTITWFKGDFRSAKAKLEGRMKKVMAKNPWLRGRIMTSGMFKGRCNLSYTKLVEASDDINVQPYLTTIDPGLSPISHDMSIASQNYTLLHSAIYLSDIFLRNGPNEPFFRVSLIPCSKRPHEAFAMVFQLSHTVGDGATYYNLMHMLCSTDDGNDDDGDPIVELIPERIKESKKMQVEALGKAEVNLLTSFGFILTNILGMFMNQWKGYLPVEYAFIDPSQVQALKASSAKEAGIPFVSTNDVLTSRIISNSNSTLGLMAINWRNRLEGHTNLHAGNYENLIFYRKEDSSSPALIRQSLDTYKRVVTRNKLFPSWWEVASTTFSCVTNWSTFSEPNFIEGCVEDVHFPLVLAEAVPSHRFRMFIIFRTGTGKIGIMYPRGVLSLGADPSDLFGLTN